MTICQKCNKDVDDIRTLTMACGYDMDELDIPFKRELVGVPCYTLEVCKYCRAEWMSFIGRWWHTPSTEDDSVNSGIFIRQLGAIIEVSEEEFRQMYPGKEPVRVKK